MCKPIFPIVQDELAHLFWKAQHIATVHHHHGDHHAEVEIAEAAHEEEDQKNVTITKTSEPISVHVIIQTIVTIPQLSLEKQKFIRIGSLISTISLNKHYPPPKCC